jgi:hypothetical protein
MASLCEIFAPCAIGKAILHAPGAVASSAADGLFASIAAGVSEAVTWVIGILASWTQIPSTPVCQSNAPLGSATMVTDCANSAWPSGQLQHWVLSITILVATFGVVWQGLRMIISRKGEPLLYIVRGIWNTVLWGAVGIAATQLLLHLGDSYSTWVLRNALSSVSPNATFAGELGAIMLIPGAAPLVTVLVGIVAFLTALIQTVLMVFREASIAILAGLLQLSAAGGFTKRTSGWATKVTGWMLALLMYKPAAATVYAVAFLLMGSPDKSGRDFVVGIATLALSIIAMPALMRFFTWTVDGLQDGGGGLGLLGGAAAAGMHAQAAMRSVGGATASDQANNIDHSLGSAPPQIVGNTPSAAASSSPPSVLGGLDRAPAAGPAAGSAAGASGAASSAGAAATASEVADVAAVAAL